MTVGTMCISPRCARFRLSNISEVWLLYDAAEIVCSVDEIGPRIRISCKWRHVFTHLTDVQTLFVVRNMS